MGASSSKLEEDKALQLCRERKKFVRQALDGRCALAAAHVTYIHSLRSTGTALRKFVEPEVPIESSLFTSTSATPDALALTEKSHSHFSTPSSLPAHHVGAAETFSPSPSPPSSSRFQVNHMKFRGFSSKRVEEKPPEVVTGTVTYSHTQENTTSSFAEKRDTSPLEDSSVPPGTPQWDYFELFHPIDHQFSFQEGRQDHQGFENADDLRQLREEEGIPELEDDERVSHHVHEESGDSEDEFDDPPTNTLVRSFENLNRVHAHVARGSSPTKPSGGSNIPETELLNGEKNKSSDLSPLRSPPSVAAVSADTKKTPVKEDKSENTISSKDFFASVKDIEFLFVKASDSGKEVPRMLEANKLHFRPINTAAEDGSVVSTLFKACFSCGEDPSQVQKYTSDVEMNKVKRMSPGKTLSRRECTLLLEPVQTEVKYLTWHRTMSSRSSPSRNLLGLNAEDLTGNTFDNFCMISGSHASTLDRLYAWERKLYDEVKASEMVRREYDSRCKILRELESKGESSQKIDKTRAVVKDLHSRMRVAIHRIDSISTRIEELRDKELQPQFEELIDGLTRMWHVMSECHKLQVTIISISYNHGHTRFFLQSESHRQITFHLERELGSLSSSFTKWIGAQKTYLLAINNWLFKCVSLPHMPSRKKRRQQDPSRSLRDYGPPVYATCGLWLDKLEALPVKEVTDSIKALAAETSGFLPHQEKNHGKRLWKADNGSDSAVNMMRDEGSEDCISGFERFRSSMEGFLNELSHFADSSVNMYTDIIKAIQDSKNYNERLKSQTQVA